MIVEGRHYPDDLPVRSEKKASVPEVRAFLDALGAPDHAFRITHIAGTSGRGSVCAHLAETLCRAGYHAGIFVSPHLVDIRECILTDGKVASSEVFRAAAEMVKRQGETEVRANRDSPAYFEYLYYMAMLPFREVGYEIVTLEIGLDGRLDATNSYAFCLTVLTSISLDHMQCLGDTVERIMTEEADIIKKKVPVVYLDAVPSVADIIAMRAWEVQAPVCPVAPDWTDTHFASLPAPYQRENAAFAVKAFQIFSEGETGGARRRTAAIPLPEAVRTTVQTTRMQEIYPDVLLDDAHNADGVLRMVEAGVVLAAKRGKKPLLLTSSAQGKELAVIAETFVRVLCPACIYLTPLHTPCRTGVYALADIYCSKGTAAAKTYGSVGEAFRQARGEQAEDAILFIVDSLYLVGEILVEESK